MSDDDVADGTAAQVSKLCSQCQRTRVTKPSQSKVIGMLIPHGASLLRIDWLATGERSLVTGPGRLGLSACPGRPDLGGTVEDDVAKLRSLGVDVAVTLVDDRELEFYGVFGLRGALRKAGLQNIHFPMRDAEPPTDLLATRALCQELLRWLGEGKEVLIHCIGGWGRSGTIAASLLIHEGHTAQDAISQVRRARSPRCVESTAQERFVEKYAEDHKHLRRFFVVLPQGLTDDRIGGQPGNRRLRRGARPPLAICEASGLRSQLAQLQDPTQARIVSGEALPEQLHSDVDLAIDRGFVQKDGGWRAVKLADLLATAIC